jgi:excisionase family DNA binding protein
MSLFDEEALRALIADAVRKAIREDGGARVVDGPSSGEYLPVATAARIAAVAPATIRTWIGDGRLGRYRAGRELRVRRAELERLLRTVPTAANDTTPEDEADRFLQRRRQSGRRP